MSTPTGHRNNQLNKRALPNSLKGPKIILDGTDRHVSKDGPFRILGNALTYLLLDFFGITFFIFYHRHVNVWSNSHSNGLVLWNLCSKNANFSWLRRIPTICDTFITGNDELLRLTCFQYFSFNTSTHSITHLMRCSWNRTFHFGKDKHTSTHRQHCAVLFVKLGQLG